MEKNVKFSIVLFMIIFLVGSVSAERAIQTRLEVDGLNPYINTIYIQNYPTNSIIFNDFIVSLLDLKIININNLNEFLNSTNYTNSFIVHLLDIKNKLLYETSFYPDFTIYSDPPIETNETIVELNLPYYSDAKYLKVYYENEEKLNVGISQLLCNNNGKCENEYNGFPNSNENYLSCSDCKWYDKDNLCTGAGDVFNLSLRYWEDHYCDLDCYKDDDCNKENCNDGIKNQDETFVDKGGICDIIPANLEMKPGQIESAGGLEGGGSIGGGGGTGSGGGTGTSEGVAPGTVAKKTGGEEKEQYIEKGQNISEEKKEFLEKGFNAVKYILLGLIVVIIIILIIIYFVLIKKKK